MVDGALHVAVPVQYVYTDARWADRAFTEKELQRLGGRRMLYHFGEQVYPVKFQRRTGKSIKEQPFCSDDGKISSNVFDWTVSKAGAEAAGRRLDPASPAIRYRNLGNEKERFGALALCKLILNNEDPWVAASRREHQRTPQGRIDSATGIVKKYLTGLRLGGAELKISPESAEATAWKALSVIRRFGWGTGECCALAGTTRTERFPWRTWGGRGGGCLRTRRWVWRFFPSWRTRF